MARRPSAYQARGAGDAMDTLSAKLSADLRESIRALVRRERLSSDTVLGGDARPIMKLNQDRHTVNQSLPPTKCGLPLESMCIVTYLNCRPEKDAVCTWSRSADRGGESSMWKSYR